MINDEQQTLFLFDVDGTLTYHRSEIKQNIIDILLQIKKKKNCYIGIISGTDYCKILEQIKNPEIFDYIFSENGVVAYKNNKQISEESIIDFLGEEKLKKLLNYCLIYIANLDIPKKRGTFIELRKGLINISPIGRNCSFEERKEFSIYNLKNDIIKNFRLNLMKEFKDFDLNFVAGGQISLDCFPNGWDKTYCLKHVENIYQKIYFFGDKVDIGGNDYEIFNDKRVIAYAVKDPDHTIEILKELIKL